jgi:hypothetical protein
MPKKPKIERRNLVASCSELDNSKVIVMGTSVRRQKALHQKKGFTLFFAESLVVQQIGIGRFDWLEVAETILTFRVGYDGDGKKAIF